MKKPAKKSLFCTIANTQDLHGGPGKMIPEICWIPTPWGDIVCHASVCVHIDTVCNEQGWASTWTRRTTISFAYVVSRDLGKKTAEKKAVAGAVAGLQVLLDKVYNPEAPMKWVYTSKLQVVKP